MYIQYIHYNTFCIPPKVTYINNLERKNNYLSNKLNSFFFKDQRGHFSSLMRFHLKQIAQTFGNQITRPEYCNLLDILARLSTTIPSANFYFLKHFFLFFTCIFFLLSQFSLSLFFLSLPSNPFLLIFFAPPLSISLSLSLLLNRAKEKNFLFRYNFFRTNEILHKFSSLV